MIRLLNEDTVLAVDTSQSGSHLEEKPIVGSLVEQLKDTHNDLNVVPEIAKPKIVKQIDDTVKKKDEPVVPEVKISEDGIKKEEQAIADEKIDVSKDPQIEIQEKNEEIQELKESNDKLEKEVHEMKEVLVKQNEETQKLVLQKFEEIAEKVEKIEKQSLESGPSGKEKPLEEDIKPEARLEEPIKLVQAPVISDLNNAPLLNASLNVLETLIVKAPEIKKVETKNETSDSEIKAKDEPLKLIQESIKTESLQAAPVESNPAEQPAKKTETRVDPIVKLIKSQEPLSYQVGEKMMESKKANATVAEEVKVPDADSSELKNEMRKKRESPENESEAVLSSLGKTLHNFEVKSIITRDLKASSDEA